MPSKPADDGFVPAPEPDLEQTAFHEVFEGSRGDDGKNIQLSERGPKSDKG